ncbi:MAG: trypsin-like peptidase domain-containing protein [Planctomycetota bacterium]
MDSDSSPRDQTHSPRRITPPESGEREFGEMREPDFFETPPPESQVEEESENRRLFFVRIDPADSAVPTDEVELPQSVGSGAFPVERVDDFSADDVESNSMLPPEPPPTNVIEVRTPVDHSRRGEPLRHAMVMLMTVGLMLAAARFVLPGIVEEIRYAQFKGQLRAESEEARQGLKDVSLDMLSYAYQNVSAAAKPSVVHIDIKRSTRELPDHPEVPGAPSILISDQGSGVVVDEEGYILTNRHVIASSDEISVTLSDGRRLQGFVVGTDERTDLAVLKVEAEDLIPIPWGDSDRLRVGSPVWAIGSPFGLDRTVTFGILSGKHRVVRAKDRFQDFMQSDVAVNPGNSGGPLVDSRGTLIGINTAIVGDTYQGVSFSIPSTVARKIYEELRRTGEFVRGWLGVRLVDVPDSELKGDDHRTRGAMISSIASGESGAAKAGLLAGDIILSIDEEPIRDVFHLMQVVGNSVAGSQLQLGIARGEEEFDVEVRLSRAPSNL